MSLRVNGASRLPRGMGSGVDLLARVNSGLASLSVMTMGCSIREESIPSITKV